MRLERFTFSNFVNAVYLRTDPEQCLNRLVRRLESTRAEETAVSLGYLQQLHDAHEAWIGDDRFMANAPFDKQPKCKRLVRPHFTVLHASVLYTFGDHNERRRCR